MTLLGYFNSPRELGGCRRIVEDEVNSQLCSYGKRLRIGETEGPFANREIKYEVVELTSRIDTSQVAKARDQLQKPFWEKEHVDVALATNMISVGLDIMRLGLMVVTGQPKTTAEYIQATSRVGRDDERPGLIVTLLNIYRPRDRSHYERFEAYHQSFYRGVEATSVTPFSPRAIDRTLAAVVVALARHGIPDLTVPLGAAQIGNYRAKLDYVADTLARRAELHDWRLTSEEVERLRQKLRGQVRDLLDEWEKIANACQEEGVGLQYQQEVGKAQRLLFSPFDVALMERPPSARKFRANRSMREVEQSVNLWVYRHDDTPIPTEETDA
jgi:superfamily II DNA/RNA helicase